MRRALVLRRGSQHLWLDCWPLVLFRCLCPRPTGCPSAHTCTLVLRGGSEQFLDEADRSLHDAIMIVRRALKSPLVVPGGGAIDMELSKHLRCERLHARLAARGAARAQQSAARWQLHIAGTA